MATGAPAGYYCSRMARKLRLEFPGACYHVINRGNYSRNLTRYRCLHQHSDPTWARLKSTFAT
jgi:hypothetical protein